MSRAVLADKAGITREGVRLIEIGKSKPNAATIKAIADVLGCSVMDLLTEEAAA
jgi:DNA-binding XRE family transcriptional regulator